LGRRGSGTGSSDSRRHYSRLTWILRKLRAGKGLARKDMETGLEVSSSTARRLFESLRDDWNVPLEYDGARHQWFLADPAWQGGFFPVSADELAALAVIQSVSSQISAPFVSPAVQKLGEKIAAMLAEEVPGTEVLKNRMTARIPGTSPVDDGVFRAVTSALVQRKRVRIEYRSAWKSLTDTSSTQRDIEPLHLIWYEGSFKLIAFCRLRKEIRIFSLDGIKEARILDEAFRPPADFNPSKYIEGAFGIMKGKKARTVKVRVEPELAQYISRQVWHRDQKDRVLKNGSLVRTFRVEAFEEIKRFLLGFGTGVYVLSPIKLRREIELEAIGIIRRYMDNDFRSPHSRTPLKKGKKKRG